MDSRETDASGDMTATLSERLTRAEREIVQLRIRLYEAENWNQALEASYRFRLGRALVDAVATRRAAVELPGKLIGLAKDAYQELQERRQLLNRGFPLPPRSEQADYTPTPGQVLYVLHSSYPYHSAGYAVRSHRLLQALKARSVAIQPLTRLGYPLDMGHDPSLSGGHTAHVDTVEGITYQRLLVPPSRVGPRSGLGQSAYLERYGTRLTQEARARGTALIHAASNYQNGLAAAFAGRRLGIPVLYEVRGLWDLTRIAREPAWRGSVEHRIFRRLESQAALEADHVVTLTGGLKTEFIDRGVDANKITVIPNCVDPDAFSPRPKDGALLQTLDMEGKIVIGYVGSLLHYEGLELLVRAFARVRHQEPDVRLLIVGEGSDRDRLLRTIKECGIGNECRYVGRVAPADVPRYYSLIDIAPFPRRGFEVCELVAPLKPLEAMAAGKAVLVSDVAALAEIVTDGETGLIHPRDDVDALTERLRMLVTNAELRSRLGTAARTWTIENRTWSAAAGRFAELYEILQDRQRLP
ncbi:MAG: hypothetical protein CMM50_15045 [Rhodospirillaceae bacterium]|nr:hypothetical protein [Rhodospirillaceae bacterium]